MPSCLAFVLVVCVAIPLWAQDKKNAATETTFRAVLLKPVNLALKESSAASALTSVGEQIGQPITIDDKSLREKGVDLRQPVSLNLKAVTARSALARLLSPFKCVCVPADGGLQVTTANAAAKRSSSTTYDISGLGDSDTLVELFTRFVQPQSWARRGAAGTVAATQESGRSLLVVQQTTMVHDNLELLVETLRRASAGKLTFEGVAIEPELVLERHLRIESALDRKRTAAFDAKPLRDCLQSLADGLDINLVIDSRTLKDGGIDIDQSVSLNVKNISTRSILSLLLEERGLRAIVLDESLFVTTNPCAADQYAPRVYDVTGFGSGHDWGMRLTETIYVDSWDVWGGPGSHMHLKVGDRDLLVVRNSPAVLQAIDRLFRAVNAIIRNSTAQQWVLDAAPPDPRFTKALNQPLTVDLKKTPLQNMLVKLAEASGIPIVVRHKDLQNEGIDIDTTVSLGMSNDLLEFGLKKVLDPLSLTAHVEHEVLLITTRSTVKHRAGTVLYDVSDMGLHAEKLPGILLHLHRETWKEPARGPGVVMFLKFRDRRMLLVYQTLEMHEVIRAFLRERRRPRT